MATASFVSLHLARFDHLRVAGPVDPGGRPGLLFCEVGADCRAAGTDPASSEAFTFLVLGLHDTEASADTLATDITTIAPWFGEAVERWSGVLAPFRTKGEANLIEHTAPANLFVPHATAPGRDDPVVVLTTIGWDRDGLDMARVQDIGTGTAAVRILDDGGTGPADPADVLLPRDHRHRPADALVLGRRGLDARVGTSTGDTQAPDGPLPGDR